MRDIAGIAVIPSDMVPEFSREAVEDYEDRLAAMTAHHIDLSLLDLTTLEPVVWVFGGQLLCHPANIALLRRTMDSSRG